MGEVLIKYRLMPDGPEIDLDDLQSNVKQAMPEFAKLERAEAKPFAFGMSALEATIVVQDEEGNNDKIEEILAGVDGIQGVELLEMGRL